MGSPAFSHHIALAVAIFLSLVRIATAAPPARFGLEQIEAYLRQNPSSSVEDFVAGLPEELRSRFLLVYESRSPHGGSLKLPRVILASPEMDLILAFATDPNSNRSHSVEVMHVEPDSNQLRFAEILFNGEAGKVNREPAACTKCHGGPTIDGWKTPHRPIWDRYPNWPGVYGSAHNDIYLKRGWFGSSQKTDLEFEELGHAELKRAAATNRRLGALVGLQETTLPMLSTTATQFTEGLARRQAANVAQAVIDRLIETYLERPAEFEKVVAAVTEVGERETIDLAQLLSPEDRVVIQAELRRGDLLNLRRKVSLEMSAIEKYGTPTDRTRLPYLAERIVAIEKSYGAQNPAEYLLLGQDEISLFRLGIDPFSMSNERGYGRYGVAGLRSNGLGSPNAILGEHLEEFLADPEKYIRQRRAAVCKIYLMPTAVQSVDQSILDWMRKIGSEQYADELMRTKAGMPTDRK